MSNYPKYFLTTPIAENGDKTITPATSQSAGTGRMSQEKGWTEVNQMPIAEGGIPPMRTDFNGAFYLLSQLLFWYQQGGQMNYSSNFDYEVGNEILMNGVKYRALKDNGPASKVVSPGTDPKTWKNMDANVPAGSVIPFANVTLGGSDGRRPIFWGQTEADEGWVLCDGGEGVNELTVPNLSNRFVLATTEMSEVGETGGSESVSISLKNIPAHTHTVTIDSNGDHNHSRGNMNITAGGLGVNGPTLDWAGGLSGAFYKIKSYSGKGNGSYGAFDVGFDAARSWTGNTSTNGNHTHTATCSTVGDNNQGPSAINTLPPYYKLAYFVKLPE